MNKWKVIILQPLMRHNHETTETREVSQSQRRTITCFLRARRGRGDKTAVNTDDEESLSRVTFSHF